MSGNTYSSVDALLEAFIEKAKETLERTPEMLPVLKKAGVVDSGGAGLICIMDGMLRCLRGEIADETTDPTTFHHEPQPEELPDVTQLRATSRRVMEARAAILDIIDRQTMIIGKRDMLNVQPQ